MGTSEVVWWSSFLHRSAIFDSILGERKKLFILQYHSIKQEIGLSIGIYHVTCVLWLAVMTPAYRAIGISMCPPEGDSDIAVIFDGNSTLDILWRLYIVCHISTLDFEDAQRLLLVVRLFFSQFSLPFPLLCSLRHTEARSTDSALPPPILLALESGVGLLLFLFFFYLLPLSFVLSTCSHWRDAGFWMD